MDNFAINYVAGGGGGDEITMITNISTKDIFFSKQFTENAWKL